MANIKTDREIELRKEGEMGGGPDMIEQSIKLQAKRDQLDLGESYVCIGVMPGTELGQLFFNVQAEGPTRSREPQNADPLWRELAVESCMESQNALMGGFTQWLREFLNGMLASDVDVEVGAVGWPCPFAKAPLQIEASMDHLEGIVAPVSVEKSLRVEEHTNSTVPVSETVSQKQ
jgi:hypothetical protein